MTEWWTAQHAAWIGSIGGSALGVLGGVIGTAAGVLAPRGKGRGLVLGAMTAIPALGGLGLAAGLAALATGQPYHVWFPLCLLGGMMAAIFGPLIPVVRMRYREAERRRLEAESLRRS